MSDMNMENLMEDSVAFRVRAKRGCATHPRSIAERVNNIQSLFSMFWKCSDQGSLNFIH